MADEEGKQPNPDGDVFTRTPEAPAEPQVKDPYAEVFPWEGEATRADKICLAAIMLFGLYALVTLPLRPLILSWSTHVLAVFSGSNLAMIDIGAGVAAGGEKLWWMWLLLAALTSIKFDWIYWWAGKLWGHRIIEMLIGKSRYARRTAAMAERLAARWGGPAVFLVWFVPFIPGAIVYAFVGMAGLRLRWFLLADFLGGVVFRGLYMYLGYEVGEPAKQVVDTIGKYALWISLVLVVFVVWKSMRSAKQDELAAAAAEMRQSQIAAQQAATRSDAAQTDAGQTDTGRKD